MTLNVKFDPILGKLRESDVGLVSFASVSIPDPLVINNLSVKSTASFNLIKSNTLYASTISTGNLTANNIAIASVASINLIHANSILASTATLGYTHISTIDWNLTSGVTLTVEGQMNWDSTNQTVVVGMAGGNVDVALGMETLFPKRVVNSTATLMPKGTVVYINGVSGNDPTVTRAIATADMSSAFTLGMTSEDIGSGQKGWVTTFGEIAGLNLSAYTGGDTLYLSGVSAGMFTNTPQLAPYHYVRVGTVVKATPDGSLVVNVINGYELNELHNVAISSLVSGQILQSGVSNLWYNVTPNFIPTASYPSLGSLAVLNSLSYTSLTNQPSLGSLAQQNTVDYVTQVTSKPSLGSLAILNSLSYTSLLNLPSLGSLAILNSLSYTSLTNLPSLGSFAVLNELSYYSLISKPSLGSLAPLNAVTQTYLPSNVSFNIIYTNGIANNSTISTNILNSNTINVTSITADSISSNLIYGNTASLLTGNIINLNVASTASINKIYTNSLNASTASINTLYASNISVSYLNGYVISGQNTGDQILPVYGNGADGYVDFNSNNTYSFATFNGAVPYTYTLTRDVFAEGININASVTVITAGYKLIANSYISNEGTIHNSGSNATGTTAGAGGLGGFYKAGGTGATGLLAASAGANGTAQATPTANTWVGGVGGKGGQGRATNTTFTGGQITTANMTVPANADGGSRVTSNFISYLTRYIVGATNWQMTPSVGGGSGAKSTTGTTATSGAGGGGGGICFVAAPIITGNGYISANGGNGGDATGTGGTFGGGGGGGGGVACVVSKSIDPTITVEAIGGYGGQSVIGTNGTLPITIANGTNTTATTTMTITPTTMLNQDSLYFLTFHLNITGGIGGSGINGITSGYGLTWRQVSGSRVAYATIASPTRVQETWYGIYEPTAGVPDPDLVDNNVITVYLSDQNTAARAILDEVQNVDAGNVYNPGTGTFFDPVTTNIGTNSSNSATTLTVTLASAPTSGNLVYSVFTRAGGTAPVAGTNNTLVNNQTTAPLMVSEVNTTGQQANAMSHTTAAAIAGFSVEVTKTGLTPTGYDGWNGKVIRIYG